MNSTSNDGYIIKNSTCLVTGGCGFIGSHLVAELLERGSKQIRVLDSLVYGKRENLEGLAENPSVRIIEHTLGISAVEELAPACENVDFLFHLAAEKHNQSKNRPSDVIDANIKGTANLFEAAANAGVKKTVFSSSLYAYGKMTLPAFSEYDVPVPNTVYGISKLAGERLLDYTTRNSEMLGDNLRFFFVYGPKQFAGLGYKSVIMKNFERIAAGKPPVIFGDGEQALDYIFVDDVVDCLIRCAESTTSGETMNVASGRATSVGELTVAMLRVADSNLAPVFEDPDWTAGSQRTGTTDLIKEKLNWSASTSLVDGLQVVWNWMNIK